MKKIRIVFIIAVIAIGGVFYLLYLKPMDYVIPGVPYYGQYTGNMLLSDSQAVAGSLLGYWGDNKVGFDTVASALPLNQQVYFEQIAGFFQKYNYTAEVRAFSSPSDFYSYVNPRTKTPIIVVFKIPMPADLQDVRAYKYAILIGVLPSQQKLVLHDSIYGNNYLLDYSDFIKLTNGVIHKFLVVRPSLALLTELKPRGEGKPYPARLPIMDDPDIIDISTRWLVAGSLRVSTSTTTADIEKLKNQLETIVSRPGFPKLHPLTRIHIYVRLATAQRALKDYHGAISTIEKLALPLNHDLNQPYNGWARDSSMPKELAIPWLSLEQTWRAAGNLSMAKQAFNHAIKINPLLPEVQADRKILENLSK